MAAPHRVLHILPHAGGGVGTVLRALLTAESKECTQYTHSVATLEYLNEKTQTCCNTLGIEWTDKLALRPHSELGGLVQAADIVVLHWWNHPYIMRLLFQGLPPCRLLIWSHVNGFYPPQAFFPELFDMPEFFVFSCQSSYNAPVVQDLPDQLKSRLRTIRSCSGIPEEAHALHPKSDPFQAGYIGTVESVKMHPDFLSLCSDANLPTPCIVAGGPDEDRLRSQAQAMGQSDKFDILGQVPNPIPIFQSLHAFAYPLTPQHYGTGEQVLIEAMAFGAVPVVLDNPPECDLVRHRETGLIASTPAEFSASLRSLYEEPAERERMAANAHQFVLDECDITHSIRAFHDIFSEVLNTPCRSRRIHLPIISELKAGSPCHLYLSSLNGSEYQRLMIGKKPASERTFTSFTSPTRGTPFHYLKQLGQDADLESICLYVTNSEKSHEND